jgi:hypothetical protein
VGKQPIKNVKQHKADLKDLRDLRAAKLEEADAPTMSLREVSKRYGAKNSKRE